MRSRRHVGVQIASSFETAGTSRMMQSRTFGGSFMLEAGLAQRRPASRSRVSVQALFTKKGTKNQPEAPPKPKKQSVLSQVTEALDFAQTRSEGDRQLIDKARTSVGKKEKMSREQYQALRRKVGGTARDYWKDYVEADEVKGFKSQEASQVIGLPFLLAVVVGLLVATGVVVSQTGGNAANPSDIPVEQQSPTRQPLSELR